MKISIDMIFLSLLVSFIPIQVGADIRKDCRKQTGVSWNSLNKLKAGNFVQKDPKLKCYLKCFMQKNGIFGKNDIDVEKALRHLPPGLQVKSRKTLERCRKIPTRGSCDKAFQLARCFFTIQPEVLSSVPFV
ncbi:general odorant-binding protein 56d-like [Chelonus insularis]|uniref:general odorant-binding protein 56d-like n=1 Tax=Chelonus insularis TaxID=460826 RepID=UPI00158F63A5|nr:general odorant-binding protein 56d-like [Chelonus insularis]